MQATHVRSLKGGREGFSLSSVGYYCRHGFSLKPAKLFLTCFFSPKINRQKRLSASRNNFPAKQTMGTIRRPLNGDLCKMRGQAHRLRQSAVCLLERGGGLETPPGTHAVHHHFHILTENINQGDLIGGFTIRSTSLRRVPEGYLLSDSGN